MTPLEGVFSACTTQYLIRFSSWYDILRTKTSSFHHQCQRSRLSPSCQRGRTGALTQLWTSSGKKPGNDWWQQSALHQYDRTPPQKALTASKSTSPRPRPASENEPAPIIEEQSWLTSDIHWHKRTGRFGINTPCTTDAQKPIPHSSTAGDRRNVGITGHRKNPE